METKTKIVYEVSLVVNGIKGKDRKVKRHALMDNIYLDSPEINDKAKEWITKEIKSFKTIKGDVKGTFYYTQIGDEFKTVQLFDKRHVDFKLDQTDLTTMGLDLL